MNSQFIERECGGAPVTSVSDRDEAPKTTLTFRFRLKDKHASELNRQSRAVNFVWNFCNDSQKKAAQSGSKWLTAFDLQKLTSGTSKELGLHAHTIQRVCRTYDNSRKARNKPWLRWRGKKSLGWVPFNTGHVSFKGKSFEFRGAVYEVMHIRSELIAGTKIGAGSFSRDAQGRWYLNAPVKKDHAASAPLSYIGIDLGVRTLAALSNGQKIEAPRFYRASEETLATAQRARKAPRRIRKIHAKIANRRKDFLHKASARIASEYGLIIVGDVSPSQLAQTSLAKSIFDAGWADFKSKLSYKAIMHGGCVFEVSERLTSKTCSTCGVLPKSRPKGIAGLSKRIFECDGCGSILDRDVNAAINIRRIGLDTLKGGTNAG